MRMFIIKRLGDGKFVAPPGQEHSYIRQAIRARKFDTRADAERECYSNERVVEFDPDIDSDSTYC